MGLGVPTGLNVSVDALSYQLNTGNPCFTVEVARKTTPAKTYSEAKANVVRLGTVPGRWSWDHPSNSHLKMH